MKRRVESELLDQLPPADPAAQHSRRDLRRINRLMGNAGILARALQSTLGNQTPRDILELGAGDGHLLLQVACRLAPRWPNVPVRLLDRVPVVAPVILREFKARGWPAESVTGEVPAWLAPPHATTDVMLANLFLHHFNEDALRTLLGLIAIRANRFVAVEPRRGTFPLLTSRLLGLIGCNAVTRHDARKSVRAGFSGRELSRLWPASDEWQLTERPAGPFSHLFIAQRRSP